MKTNGAPEQAVFGTRGRTRSTALEQPRPGREDGYLEYGAAEVPGLPPPPSVLIGELAYRQLRDHTLAGYPNETTGVLVGRPCRDGNGNYILVKAAVVAEGDEFVGSPGNFRISGKGRISLAKRAARMFPGDQVVGAFHSHPHSPPRFSEVDFREQEIQHSSGIGIVVGAQEFRLDGGDDNDPLGVYIGPNAIQLWRLKERRHAPVKSPAAENAPPPRLKAPVDRPSGRRNHNEPTPDHAGRADPQASSKPSPFSRSLRRPGVKAPRLRLPDDVPVPVALALAATLVVAALALAVWISIQSIDQGDVREATAGALRDTQARTTGLTVPGPVYCRETESVLTPLGGKGMDPTVTTVASDDPGVASASITPQGRALRIDCLAEGDAGLTVESPGGSGIVLPIHVTESRHVPELGGGPNL